MLTVSRRVRLTPLGAAIIGLLAAGVVALIVGSRTLQAVGFVVALIVVLVLVADNLPRSARPDGRGPGRGPGYGRGSGYGPGSGYGYGPGAGYGPGSGVGPESGYGRGRGARPGPPTEQIDDSTH